MKPIINSRVLTTFQPFENNLIQGPIDLRPATCSRDPDQKNYLFDLSYLSVITLNGPKSAEFLQGQVTCDVRKCSETHMVQGAQCDLKGRILSLMDIINWQGLKLVLPQDLVAATIHSLTKTALLSRVSLLEDQSLKIFGFYLQNSADLLPLMIELPKETNAQTSSDLGCCYNLGEGFFILIVKNHCADELNKNFIAANQLLGSLTWHSLRLKNRHIEIYPESRGLFLPHRLGLHLTEYISFNKGCYKGQEIIARTHYKATLKHEFKVIEMSLPKPVVSGETLIDPDSGSEIGEVVDYACLGGERYLLGIIVGL